MPCLHPRINSPELGGETVRGHLRVGELVGEKGGEGMNVKLCRRVPDALHAPAHKSLSTAGQPTHHFLVLEVRSVLYVLHAAKHTRRDAIKLSWYA